MIVNVNQCASMYDETLNVLKFSAVAQKVLLSPSLFQLFMPFPRYKAWSVSGTVAQGIKKSPNTFLCLLHLFPSFYELFFIR